MTAHHRRGAVLPPAALVLVVISGPRCMTTLTALVALCCRLPRVAGTPVVNGTGGAAGFNGLDDFQQTAAGTGIYASSQFDVTPPDQGLCVGNGDLVEPINLAVRVYSTQGTPLT